MFLFRIVVLLFLFSHVSLRLAMGENQSETLRLGPLVGGSYTYGCHEGMNGDVGFVVGLDVEASVKSFVLSYSLTAERAGFTDPDDDWHHSVFAVNTFGLGYKSRVNDNLSVAPFVGIYYGPRWDVLLSDWLKIDLTSFDYKFKHHDAGLDVGVGFYTSANIKITGGYKWAFTSLAAEYAKTRFNHFFITFSWLFSSSKKE